MLIRALVVMGVSGAGKSTLGHALALACGWPFIEGDTLHPLSNIAKMSAGVPLDDDDRWPFFDNVASVINAHASHGVVVTCSALKRAYRDYLRDRCKGLCFVFPAVSRETLAERLAHRTGHFMPMSLLDSQLEILEPPDAYEHAVLVDGCSSTQEQLRAVLAAVTFPSVRSSR